MRNFLFHRPQILLPKKWLFNGSGSDFVGLLTVFWGLGGAYTTLRLRRTLLRSGNTNVGFTLPLVCIMLLIGLAALGGGIYILLHIWNSI